MTALDAAILALLALDGALTVWGFRRVSKRHVRRRDARVLRDEDIKEMRRGRS